MTYLLFVAPLLAACAELEPVRTVPAIVDPASSATPEPEYRGGRDPLARGPRAARPTSTATEGASR